MTMDPTIKPALAKDAAEDAKVLQNLGRMKEFDVDKWVNDSYVRKAFTELGLDYDKQVKSFDNYEVKGDDKFCKKPITESRKAGEVWVAGEGILPLPAPPARSAPMRTSRPRARRSTWPTCSIRARHQAVRGSGLLHGQRRRKSRRSF